MDSHVDQAKITLQSNSDTAHNYIPTKSCENTSKPKSSDKESTFDSNSTYPADTRYQEPALWLEKDSKRDIFRTASTEQNHIRKVRKLQKRQTLPAKTVFLKWWLDTLGYSKPLRTAWEDDEESLFRPTNSSHACSPTYFSGQGVSFHQSASSRAYMFTSNLDSHVYNSLSGISRPLNSVSGVSRPLNSVSGVSRPIHSISGVSRPVHSISVLSRPLHSISGVSRPVNSASGVSRLIYPLRSSHKRKKTRTKSLGSQLNSSLSINESVNVNVSVRQQFLEKEGKFCEKRLAASGQNQEKEHEVTDVCSWLSATSSATKHLHDRNTSSNVFVPAPLSSHKTPSAEHLSNVAAVSPVLKECPMKGTPQSELQEVCGQQRSKPDIIMADKDTVQNNCHLLVSKSNGSQEDDQLLSFTVNGRDIMESITSLANKCATVELPISHHENNIQTHLKPDNYLSTFGADVSNGTPQESQHEQSQHSLLLQEEIVEAIVNSDQNFNSPVFRTKFNCYSGDHFSLSLAKEADQGSPKGSDSIDDGCLSCNNISERKLSSPNFFVHFRNIMSTELDKYGQVSNGHTNMVNDNSAPVQDENICRGQRGSYFSRLVEKRIGVKESQINIDQHASKSEKRSLSGQENDDQSTSVSTILPSSNQSNEQSQLPLALHKPELHNNHLAIQNGSLSEDLGIQQTQTTSDGSNSPRQHSPEKSRMRQSDRVNSCKNDNTNISVTGTHKKRCCSHGFCPEHQQNSYSKCLGRDALMNSPTGKNTSNENTILELEDDNNEQNSMSSYAYSSRPSTSVRSRSSSSDQDDSISEYLKYSAASLSNTSLPPQHCEPKMYKVRYAASTTKIEKIRQKQTIQTAKLLILMLDKLPTKGRVWGTQNVNKEKRRCMTSSFKCGHRYHQRSIDTSSSFHSHMLSLLKTNYPFKESKPTIKKVNKESAQQETSATNESADNSEQALCVHANLVPKHKTVNENMKLDTYNENTSLSIIDSSRKSQFHYETCSFPKYSSSMDEQDCIKLKKKHKKDICHFYQMFPKGKYTQRSRKLSSTSSFSNMQFQSMDSEQQKDSQKVFVSSKSDVKMSDQRKEKHKQNKYPTDVKSWESITQESDFRYGTTSVSKKMKIEQSKGLLDFNFSKTKSDCREGNMAAGMLFHSSTGIQMHHEPHPPDASLTVRPKHKPRAVVGIPNLVASEPKEARNSANPIANQLSVANSNMSYSSKQPLAKLLLQKKLQGSDIHDINTSAIKLAETRSFLKNHKARSTNSQKNVLPPLHFNTSENMDINSDKFMNYSKIVKPGMLPDQQKTAAPEQAQNLSSLVHPDSLHKHHCDSKSVSQENSKRKIPLSSFQNHGPVVSPLRQRFFQVKTKASNSFLKTLHNPSRTISSGPHYLCGNSLASSNDLNKTTRASPEVSHAGTNELQSLTTKTESQQGNSLKYLEMHNVDNLFVNKNNIKPDKKEISPTCENDLEVDKVQKPHKKGCLCLNNFPEDRFCNESKVNNQDRDNNNMDTTCKKRKVLGQKAKCTCTSKFKFLTLLLSDDLENSHS